jgi:hypothetical protein
MNLADYKMKDGLIDRIKSKGHWRINFQPLTVLEDKLPLSVCRETVEKNAIRLRGWDYPHIPRKNDDKGGQLPCGEYHESWTDWWNHIEFWRMYRSHQFLHYLALREDWLAESDWSKELAKTILPGMALGTGGTIFQITEIFEFLSRLGRDNVYPTGARVDISLENTKERALWVDDPQRMPFFDLKQTGANKIDIRREVTADDFLSKSSEIAQSVIIEIFEHFGWANVSAQNIRQQQEQLLAGRI